VRSVPKVFMHYAAVPWLPSHPGYSISTPIGSIQIYCHSLEQDSATLVQIQHVDGIYRRILHFLLLHISVFKVMLEYK